MRELAFELSYERGVDPVGDVFIDHPDLELTSLACFATPERLWRLDRVTGPPASVGELEAVMTDGGCCQSVPGAPRDGNHDHDVLAREEGRRVVYSRIRDGDPARSVPRLAARHFDDGLLLRNERSDGRTRWRIVVPDGEGIGEFCDVVRGHLVAGVTFEFDHVGRPSGWQTFGGPSVTLSPEKRAALEAAAENGYYERPREVELDELAAALDVPRSTLSYRLGRAEAELVEAFLAR